MNAAGKGKVWRLMVFSVPDRMVAAVTRFGFRPTKKNPANFWRTFDPKIKTARQSAHNILSLLNDAGLTSRRWDEVEASQQRSTKPSPKLNFAEHNRTPGTYRLKQRRK